jgi:REP element-mobilizing transposase RayT
MGRVMKMDKEKELPKRKHPRLDNYDYSSAGAYFVTICTKDRKRILSNIIKPSVGVGALDDPLNGFLNEPQIPQIQLSEIGKVTEKYLLSSENIPGVKIDRYVIMPDHIHVIIFLYPNQYASRRDGSSKAPTPTNEMLPHIVSTFKRFCNKEIGNNIFQRGYIEHIVRDREDYETRAKYIYENPARWYYDGLYTDE